MNLSDLITRDDAPRPWVEGDNIPWNEPGFSERMLKEHLSQDHDAASRRSDKIDRHVAWIHGSLLSQTPSRILDLGCGPGLYASRLARLGHTCTGIDYSPASIAYARQQAAAESLACTYQHEDLRKADFGAGYDLAMLLYGETNVFKREDILLILRKAWAALRPGGQLLLEPHQHWMIRQLGSQGTSWHTSSGGLFNPKPHLVLEETFWNEASQTYTARFYILDAGSGQVTRFAQSMQAYTDAGYRDLLEEAGFKHPVFYPTFGGVSMDGLFVIHA
ncbi:MAG TPA: class I SAM-dependent methyltransferase [Anaerolineaceae bacterium]|nr:class I SAM-dependent methyltransferase [Anaerolineaceae bacterium]HPN52440.1 class I SAM-dependent methyltransferase [Anaerolineaceae bacterium]